jgi:ribonuclease J
MIQNSDIAREMGRLRVPQELLITPQELRRLPPRQVAVVLTGSQGEPLSALARIAVDSHRWIHIEPGDEVALSARVIPGNEKSIFRMIDHLYRRGATVHYSDGSQPPIHVSGHGSAEELRLMLNLVRPKYFIPIHGEYRQLYRHMQAAKELVAVSREIIMLQSGDVLEFDTEGARQVGKVPVGRICIDVGTFDEVEEVILKERRLIAADGIVIPILAINEHTGQLQTPPEIVSRGFIPLNEVPELVESARQVILREVEKSNSEEISDWGVIKEKIRTALRRHFDKETGKRPMILPVILEV